MLYRDLIQFEPLDDIIQLRDADDSVKAQRLVRTFVFSERMAEQMVEIILPQIDLDSAVDHKGIFIVGNYGTGKSHLLSVISALAENAEQINSIRVDVAAQAEAAATPSGRKLPYRTRVGERARPFAGKFKVVRMEVGGVTRRLRDSVVEALENFLASVGTPYSFKGVSDLTNNKDALLEAINCFRQGYPDYGILFVLDELLDFLRGQGERDLILDLGFLRELGEVVELAPFRFIAGVQESLFDSPTFQFVSDQLYRVRERFEQVRISREDIAFVVAQRLLVKDNAQLSQITEHLRGFTKYYPLLGDRLEEYARLFPIHPAYIETLENIHLAEKRQVLKTYENAIKRILDETVPSDAPGLISYDHYWRTVLDDPSLRTQPGLVEIVAKSEVVTGRVTSAYTRPALLPMALRIVAALSVQRLTTSDINAPIGVTVDELRDNLCLWTTPAPDAQFLAANVETALREIIKTVSGQYISHNEENGQYYLDIKKDIDFDARIENRGQFVDRPGLNPFFYDALHQRLLTGLPTSTYGGLHQIWSYELPWFANKVTRPGYFFFGVPADRSTAQPPRDFYVYVLPAFYEAGSQPAEQVAAARAEYEDEVLFHLSSLDEDFEAILRNYAGAVLMADESPAHAATYRDKADAYGRKLAAWLRANLSAKLRITYRGVTLTLPELLAQMRSTAAQDIEEVIRLVASHLLEGHFADAYPDYPAFARLRDPISEQARATAAQDAIRAIAAGATSRTQLALGVLDGLKLLEPSGALRSSQSPYAQHIMALLEAKDAAHVVNHGEVIEQVAGGLTPIFKDIQFRLEPEWVAVLLVALVYEGRIELNLGTETLEAATIERAATVGLGALADFRFYRRPREMPVALWEQIFRGLGLQDALIRNESTRAQALVEMQATVQRELPDVTALIDRVQTGVTLWNAPLFTDGMALTTQDGLVVGHASQGSTSLAKADVLPALRETKTFLEKLARINSPGKLTNFQMSVLDVNSAVQARTAVDTLRKALDAVDALQPLAGYLASAETALPADEVSWLPRVRAERSRLLDALRSAARSDATLSATTWKRTLETLKKEYIQFYTGQHQSYVLGPAGDERRQRLTASPLHAQARTLGRIDILPQGELTAWEQTITSIPTCRDFHEGLLGDTPVCPRCNFRPVQALGQPAAARLALLDERLEALVQQWHSGVRDALQSESALTSLAAMTAAERAPIDAYLALADPQAATLPDALVDSVNKALRGLQTLALDGGALVDALKQGGLPCTVDDLEARFKRHMQQLMRGHDRGNTRLTIQ